MQAIVRERPGRPVLKDIPEPSKDAMDIHATSLNKADWHSMSGKPFIMRLLRVPVIGADVAGIPRGGKYEGQRVTAEAGTTSVAGHCEVGSVPDSHMAPIPESMSFEDAACLPVAGLTALQGLRDWGELKDGQRVLINGASGGVGSFAVQVAKALGADVTAMCSAKNASFVQGLGVDEVWAYDERDIEGTFDVFYDAAAYRPFAQVMRHVEPNGRYVFVGGSMDLLLPSMTTAKWRYGKRFAGGIAKADADDLTQLVEWAADGTLKVPRTATLSLAEVPDALIRMGEGRTVGKVAVRIRD